MFALALDSGDFEAAVQSAMNASKTIDTHPDKRKSPHILTLQADTNQLYGQDYRNQFIGSNPIRYFVL